MSEAVLPPAKSDHGYRKGMWGNPQPDGTVAGDGLVWWAGEVYHVGKPPSFGPYVTTDDCEWRVWVEPDEIGGERCPRYRLYLQRAAGTMTFQRWPLEVGVVGADEQPSSRESMRANQAAKRSGQTDAIARAKGSITAPALSDDMDIGDVADYVVRLAAAVVMDPDADLATMKGATDIAKSWKGIGSQHRAVAALGEATANPGELTPEARKAIVELRNRAAGRTLLEAVSGSS